MKPKFIHDCAQCKFLAHKDGHDLYFCEQNGFGPTVVARYGNDGSDYTSGLEGAQVDPIISNAKLLALRHGYLQ